MPIKLDLIGKQFGRWTVVARKGIKNGKRLWECHCTCGNTSDVIGASLTRGGSLSCGCLSHELAADRGKKRLGTYRGDGPPKSKSKEYGIWQQMKNRCYKPNTTHYDSYGGRGISVCDRWINSFDLFFEDMGSKPPFLSLDRIDNNGPYSPSNCKWSTRREQAQNRRSNKLIDFNGLKMPLVEFARAFSQPIKRVEQRIKRGWTIKDALTLPADMNRNHVCSY